MADIFLSYARPDLEIARAVAGDLEAEGYSVFFDQHIGVGENWDALIESEIEAAKCVVVLWSAVSRDREWVRNEARFGRHKGVLCPAMVSTCVVPLEFNSMQTANLCDRVAGDVQHAEWRRMMIAVARHAGAPRPAQPAGKSTVPEDNPNVLYWRAFAPIAESHGRSRHALKLPKSENYNTPLARPPGFEVYASAFVTRSKLGYGPYLWIWASQPSSADVLVPILVNMQSAINAAMGEPVMISRVTNHGIWIWLKKVGDPDDRSQWPSQHSWMAERMGKFASVYWQLIDGKILATQVPDPNKNTDFTSPHAAHNNEDQFIPLFDRVEADGAREALNELIERLPKLPSITVSYEQSGSKHRLAVRRHGDRWYSALAQKDWLLWYFRPPVVSQSKITLARVRELLPLAELNKSGEITVRLTERSHAIAVEELVAESM